MEKNIQRIVTILVIIAVTITVGDRIKQFDTNDSEVLVEAFSSTMFQLDETELNVWVEYLPKYLSIEEMEVLVGDIAKELGITDYETTIKERDNNRNFEIIKNTPTTTTKIKLVEIIEHVEEKTYKPINYIIVNISLRNKCTSIGYFESIITDYFNNLNLKSNISLTIVGSQAGEISEIKAKNIMNNVIKELDASIEDSFYYEDIKSVYGYSRNIDNYVTSKDKKINVDLTINYNEVDDKTYFYAATPVITRDY